ncbi:family 78 glycoside hydrolase catalytic domain [Pirellulales bacterium]|nr:family 78 glycoside hydrolase catalytic domain [Pirellulales bacterium]
MIQRLFCPERRTPNAIGPRLRSGRIPSCLLGVLFSTLWAPSLTAAQLKPIPDKLVVLTFDDGNVSDIKFAAPLLKEYGFGATFYLSEAWMDGGKDFVTWEQARELHDLGFEIGNHTSSHPWVTGLTRPELVKELEIIEQRCEEHGIPKPVTFANPAAHTNRHVIDTVRDLGYLFARRGTAPEFQPSDWGRGAHYDPRIDDPMLIPSTLIPGPDYVWNFPDLAWAVENATDGKIAVLTFHSVRTEAIHPWNTTAPDDFVRYMKYLHDQGCTVIALRDLANYVDPDHRPNSDPFAGIQRRFGLQPVALSCEYARNPIGIETAQPRLSWICESVGRGQRQSAFHIRVASSVEKLNRGNADKWDTGKIESDKTVHIRYQGEALSSRERCYWQVRVWDKDNRPSQWSKPSSFQMGLLQPTDWQGRWIAMPDVPPDSFVAGKLGQAEERSSNKQPASSNTESGLAAHWKLDGDLADGAGGEAGVAVGEAKSTIAPLLRKHFELNQSVRRATVNVSGIGWYELYLNGQKVGDHVLDPAPTNYHKRVLYETYDVTDLLRTGGNALGIVLGDGWYCRRSYQGGTIGYGDRPKALLQLDIELADGARMSVVSDDSWQAAASPICSNDICDGEFYDARLEMPGWCEPNFDAGQWKPAALADPPTGALASQVLPPIKVVDTIPAVRILEPRPNVYVYDFGQHFSGWTRLRVQGEQGAKVALRYAGRIHDGGQLDTRNNLNSAQVDNYILKGEGQEVWEPRFTLHGFRYVEVTGLPGKPRLEDLEGRFVRSAVESAGSFTCSNPLLNRIHNNVRWTFMSSLQGIPQDAAERYERFAWMGDPGFVAEDYLYNFDTASFWTKWLDDIRDAQAPGGEVPVYVPGDWYAPWPAWESTYPLFVWYVYQYYDDERILARHYAGMQKLLDHFSQLADDYIMPDQGQGDHMEPQADGSSSHDPLHTPVALTSTAYYYFNAKILAETATILRKTDEAERYALLAERIKQAFNGKFFDPDTNQYAAGSQTSNALALYFRLVPEGKEEAVLQNLVNDILMIHQGRLSTGIIGANALEQVLGEYGRADVMFTIASQTAFPSWGHQVLHGATTLWESFELNEITSINMKMLGSTEKFFYKDLAGIGMAAPGFKKIVIKPQVVGDLTHVDASFKTVHGLIEVGWEKNFGVVYKPTKPKVFSLRVNIPANTAARIHIPKLGLENIVLKERRLRIVWQDGKYVACDSTVFGPDYVEVCDGIVAARETADDIVLDVGSGYYVFQLYGE